MDPPSFSGVSHENLRLYFGFAALSNRFFCFFPSLYPAFCGIPKVGITQWIQFLRFTLGARDYRAHPHSKRDQRLLRFDSMREEVQMEILNGDDIASNDSVLHYFGVFLSTCE